MGLYWPGRGVPVVEVSVLLHRNLLTLALTHMKDTLALRISVGKASRRSPVICLQWPTGAGTEMPVGTGTSCGCQLQIDLKQISIANTCTSRYTGKIKRIERQCITTDLDWTLCLRYPNTRANRISPINIYYVLAMVAHLAR